MKDEGGRMKKKPTTSKQLVIPALPQLPTIERELQFDEWAATMRDLFTFENRLDTARVKYQLIVGRAFAYGQERWKRGAEHEVTRLGFALGTLYNWSSVGKRISPSIERDGLTFEDYRALAKLENDAEREQWIARKQAEGWSGKRLDAEIRKNPDDRRRTTDGERQESNGKRETNDDESRDELELDSPQPNTRTNANKFFTLVNEWQRAAEVLQARGDEMSRAQADVYLDCVDALAQAVGK